MTVRQLMWMFEGRMKYSGDLAMFLARLVPIGLLEPRSLNEGLNPYRNNMYKLPPEQEEAKRKNDGKRQLKLMHTALKQFVRNKPKRSNKDKKE